MTTRPDTAPTGGTTCLSSNLSWLLTQADHALLAENQVALAPLGLGSRGYCVLQTASGARHTQTELAEMIGLDKTTMVVTVDQLEQAGLARRVPSPTDRRARLIEVTPEGEKRIEEGQAIIQAVQSDVLSTLTADERDVLMRALAKLVAGRFAAPVECSPPIRRREPRAA